MELEQRIYEVSAGFIIVEIIFSQLRTVWMTLLTFFLTYRKCALYTSPALGNGVVSRALLREAGAYLLKTARPYRLCHYGNATGSRTL